LARRLALLTSAAVIALSCGGCLRKDLGDITGSLGSTPATPHSETEWRAYADAMGKRYDARPNDKTVVLNYAAALRHLEQYAQALAVLQQAAIRSPKDMDILGAYGRALSDVGRYKEAADVLTRAHTPERPDWRILSAQGVVADRMGNPQAAQDYYEAALKIVPNEPTVLSNLGLSYALSKRLTDAERVLRQAAANPRADARVRQNLGLVLGLQGRFAEAEAELRKDMSPQEAAQAVAYFRSSVAQQNSWKALQGIDKTGGSKPVAAARANARPPSQPATAPSLKPTDS
jgi:Flp pilus assembly protein TadD